MMLFVFLLGGLSEIYESKGCGKTHNYCCYRDEYVCAVPNKLVKHVFFYLLVKIRAERRPPKLFAQKLACYRRMADSISIAFRERFGQLFSRLKRLLLVDIVEVKSTNNGQPGDGDDHDKQRSGPKFKTINF
jgi:hypothetical protein